MSHSVQLSSREIDDLAAAWLGRQDAGLTSAEAAELAKWREADPRHAAALEKFESVWLAADRPRQRGMAGLVRQRLTDRARQKSRRRSVVGAGLAACIMLGIGLWSGGRSGDREDVRVARTVFLGPERQTLPDGSIAEFSPGTNLEVNFNGAARHVTFTYGQAHFQVVHDSARPFIVTAGGIAVRAVGTAFAVQVGVESTAVVVTSGRVAVNSVESGTQTASAPPAPLALVDAGQCIAVRAAVPGRVPVVVVLPEAEIAERLGWRRRRIEFSAAPLDDVVAVVNRYNRVQFSVDDPALARVPLSGVFQIDDAEELARLLEGNFPLKAERLGPDRILLRPRR